MEKIFNQYTRELAELINYISSEGKTQNSIDQEERNKVSSLEEDYMNTIAELNKAKTAVSSQYRSIWEQCTADGLREPRDQRPSSTDLTWHECLRNQEQAAKEIQQWFENKKNIALAEKRRRQQEENEIRVAKERMEAEKIRRQKAEADALEKAKGASLIEEMKQKYRK